MLLFSRKHSLAVLALSGSLLLPAVPAEARDLGNSISPVSQDWQSLWEQVLSWLGLGGENPPSGDQQWSHAAGKEDAGPYIDPNGLPGTNGSNGQGDDDTAIHPIGTR